MKKGKAVGMVLAVALAAGTLFSGCGNESGGNPAGESGSGSSESAKSQAPSGSEKEDVSQGEKPEISISILERGNCPAEEGTMEDNRWTRYINENSPVTVKWVPVPRTESVAKINALFAGGEAPDLVWEFGKSFMDGLYTQDVIQPVDEYVEQYSTSYKQYLEAHPELKPYLIAEDGKMYGMTSARTPLGVANHGMWIRKDWLDALELPVPQTMEELNAAALAFTKEDPDGNGQNDTFGIGFNYNWITIMKSMYGQPSEGMMVEDGIVGDWSGSQGYGDCFAQIKSWYENGVIDPEYVTDTNYEKQRQYLVTGKTGIWLGSYNAETEWRELKTNVPEAEWIPLEPVETAYGRFGRNYRYLQDKMPALTDKQRKGFSKIECLVSGGDRISVEENREFEKAFGCPLVNGYGNNEGWGALTVNPASHNKYGTVGVPKYDDIIISYDNESQTELKYGECGEICALTDTAFLYYEGRQKETDEIKKRHPDGKIWIHTGDIGYIDEDGYVHLEGRMRRVIIRGGFKLSADMIEEKILENELVKECVVVGVKDESEGEVPMAFILLNPELGKDLKAAEKAILDGLSIKMKQNEIPKWFEFVDSLPYTENGKYDFRRLEGMGEEYLKGSGTISEKWSTYYEKKAISAVDVFD